MATSLPLSGQVALVAGATRGAGRGIALQLASALGLENLGSGLAPAATPA